MIISTEDKIALLEFLGYKYLGWGRYKHQIYGTTTDNKINPLNISILTKALDIIEKTENTRILKTENSSYECSIGTSIYGGYKHISEGNTREEAILKAILNYIKTTKQ